MNTRSLMVALVVSVALALGSIALSARLLFQDKVTREEIKKLQKRAAMLEDHTNETRKLALAASSVATVANDGVVKTSTVLRALIETIRPDATHSSAAQMPIKYQEALRESAALELAPTQAQPCNVVSVASRVTESNASYSRYTWILRLSNTSNSPVKCPAEIRFKDEAGFIIATDTEYGLAVQGFSQAEFSGDNLVSAPGDSRVRKTDATVSAQ